jgi:MFS family permease
MTIVLNQSQVSVNTKMVKATPFEGYLIDRFGPRVMICGSGALVAIAWVINSVADSLFLLYVGAAIGGIGAGVIYGCVYRKPYPY